MKQIITTVIVLGGLTTAMAQNVRTSVADGLATNPFVWDCVCIPLPGDSIIINHNITLNNDFGNYGGAVVINATGKLIGDNPNRAFASTGYFENKGEFNVSRTALFSGQARNSGYFYADSLFSNITGAGFFNTGLVEIETSFWNTGKYENNTASTQLLVHDNFYNGDSLISGINAVLVNNGKIRVNQDFANSDTIRGSGQICIDGNSLNIGVITGTLDFCDISSGSIDLNLGTINSSVQFCQAPCTVGTENQQSAVTQVYPNPVADQLYIRSGLPAIVSIYDISGKKVWSSTAENTQFQVNVKNWKNGVYIYTIQSDMGSYTGKLIKN